MPAFCVPDARSCMFASASLFFCVPLRGLFRSSAGTTAVPASDDDVLPPPPPVSPLLSQ